MFRCEHHDRLDSTNAHALRVWHGRGQDQPAAPLLITAGEQSSGVGRLGRVWNSPRGGVWLTVAWPAQRQADHYEAIPLAAGLAAARAIEATLACQVQIKWPNDLLIRGRKVCGILCRFDAQAAPVVLIGIGINANFPVARLGRTLRWPATSLYDERGGPIDLTELRSVLYDQLGAVLTAYEATGLAAMGAAIRARLAWLGREVRCELPGGAMRSGVLEGIDAAGRLTLRSPDGPTHLNAGELVHLHADRLEPTPLDITTDMECVR